MGIHVLVRSILFYSIRFFDNIFCPSSPFTSELEVLKLHFKISSWASIYFPFNFLIKLMVCYYLLVSFQMFTNNFLFICLLLKNIYRSHCFVIFAQNSWLRLLIKIFSERDDFIFPHVGGQWVFFFFFFFCNKKAMIR